MGRGVGGGGIGGGEGALERVLTAAGPFTLSHIHRPGYRHDAPIDPKYPNNCK